jgi:hypothetical protein
MKPLIENIVFAMIAILRQVEVGAVGVTDEDCAAGA